MFHSQKPQKDFLENAMEYGSYSKIKNRITI